MIYFIQAGDGGPIKIGTTRNLAKRLTSMSIDNAALLVVLATCDGGHKEEKRLHRLLSQHRVRGEWYRPSCLVRSVADAAKKGMIADALAGLEALRDDWLTELDRYSAAVGEIVCKSVVSLVSEHGISGVSVTSGVAPAAIRRIIEGTPPSILLFCQVVDAFPELLHKIQPRSVA